MQIQFFCPHWGSEHLSFENFAHNVKSEGYDGVEMSLPYEDGVRGTILSILKQYDLALIAQHWETVDADFNTHKKEYERRLRNLASGAPVFINSQTGKDYFTFGQNTELIDVARQVAGQTGVPIVHETHRGKFSFAAHITKTFLERLPDLRITLDASHWCNVAESFLEDQQSVLQIALDRTDHIHARVGYPEGPQVPDPRDELWKKAFHHHLAWWTQVIGIRRSKGAEYSTITPEFGAPPYMVLTPFDHKPVCSQWEVNAYMMNTLRKDFSARGPTII